MWMMMMAWPTVAMCWQAGVADAVAAGALMLLELRVLLVIAVTDEVLLVLGCSGAGLAMRAGVPVAMQPMAIAKATATLLIVIAAVLRSAGAAMMLCCGMRWRCTLHEGDGEAECWRRQGMLATAKPRAMAKRECDGDVR